jgi:hypothetical protein
MFQLRVLALKVDPSRGSFLQPVLSLRQLPSGRLAARARLEVRSSFKRRSISPLHLSRLQLGEFLYFSDSTV